MKITEEKLGKIFEAGCRIAILVWLFDMFPSQQILSAVYGVLVLCGVLIFYSVIATMLFRQIPKVEALDFFYLYLVIGLSTVLCIGMAIRLQTELSYVAAPGWASKEMRELAYQKGIPSSATATWYIDYVNNIKHLRNAFSAMGMVMLFDFFTRFQKLLPKNPKHSIPNDKLAADVRPVVPLDSEDQ